MATFLSTSVGNRQVQRPRALGYAVTLATASG
jgi:hypothetical protein